MIPMNDFRAEPPELRDAMLEAARRVLESGWYVLGREVEVRRACRPLGEVRVRGEIWQARCDRGAGAGDMVRITGLDGLTLLVEPVLPA